MASPCIPARAAKPRDKAKVEVGVQVVERWMLARLRHHTFFSLAEVNAALAPLLSTLNARPFKKLPGSRQSCLRHSTARRSGPCQRSPMRMPKGVPGRLDGPLSPAPPIPPKPSDRQRGWALWETDDDPGQDRRADLDDWGLAPLSDENRRDLLEIVEDRHDCRATLVTSQLPVEHWHEALGDPTLADAILDRLVHNAYKITLQGESMRKRQARFCVSVVLGILPVCPVDKIVHDVWKSFFFPLDLFI